MDIKELNVNQRTKGVYEDGDAREAINLLIKEMKLLVSLCAGFREKIKELEGGGDGGSSK